MARTKTTTAKIAAGKKWQVITGDVREIAKTLEAESFHAVLCDPPYGLSAGRTCTWDDIEAGRAKASGGFMGKAWDSAVPGPSLWKEVLRLMLPGAPLIAFFGTRTYHRGTVAIEDAGFNITDMFSYTYGTGWPKGLDLSKAVDKALGAERKVTGRVQAGSFGNWEANVHGGEVRERSGLRRDDPATPHGEAWRGYNTQLKPGMEPAALARKPFAGTFAENALEHGVGGFNIDACRVGGSEAETMGRYPCNVLLGHLPECRMVGTRPSTDVGGVPIASSVKEEYQSNEVYGKRKKIDHAIVRRPDDGVWECGPDCPVVRLDVQTGDRPAAMTGRAPAGAKVDVAAMTTASPKAGAVMGRPGGTGAVYADSGGASRYFFQSAWLPGELEEFAAAYERFFYCAKAPDHERGTENNHPTVKPMLLMKYLATLIRPPRPGARLLVPFCGSGSEMLGAMLAGWDDVVGIELDPKMADVARWRIENAVIKSTTKEVK